MSTNKYKDYLKMEQQSLGNLIERWNIIQETDVEENEDRVIREDVGGQIRSAIGKTKLLLAEKFPQFEKLIEQSADKSTKRRVTSNDLDGYMEIVNIEVQRMKDTFRSIQDQLLYQKRVVENQRRQEMMILNVTPNSKSDLEL